MRKQRAAGASRQARTLVSSRPTPCRAAAGPSLHPRKFCPQRACQRVPARAHPRPAPPGALTSVFGTVSCWPARMTFTSMMSFWALSFWNCLQRAAGRQGRARRGRGGGRRGGVHVERRVSKAGADAQAAFVCTRPPWPPRPSLPLQRAPRCRPLAAPGSPTPVLVPVVERPHQRHHQHRHPNGHALGPRAVLPLGRHRHAQHG